MSRTPPGPWLGRVAFAALLIGSVVALFVVPADAAQGQVQRILYIHVPSAWVAMLSFFIVFVMSALYLVQRRLRWDLVAASAVEIGVMFTGLTLALGMLWGKPTWGVWWIWDPRLTTTAILFVIYVGYLLVRSVSEDPDQRARWSAVIGIVAFVQVPVVYLSVFWWRSIHQPPSSPRSMATEFFLVLMLNFAAFTLFYIYLMIRRYGLARMELDLELKEPTRE